MNSGINAEPDGSGDTNRNDSDAAQVLEILRGASRAQQDPDLDLVIVAARLRGAKDDAIRAALAALVSNADQD